MSSSYKLYYSPASCSASSFIVGYAGGLSFDSEEVNHRAHQTLKGIDYYSINPKGNVPAIVLGNGGLINENVGTLLFLADQARAVGKVTNLSPPEGSGDRYVFISILSFLASEVHKSYTPLFYPDEAAKPKAKENLYKKFKLIEETYLNKSPYLFGDHFTAADSYLYIMLTWNPFGGVSLEAYPKLQAFFDRVKSLDVVQGAHKRMAELSATYVKQ